MPRVRKYFVVTNIHVTPLKPSSDLVIINNIKYNILSLIIKNNKPGNFTLKCT